MSACVSIGFLVPRNCPLFTTFLLNTTHYRVITFINAVSSDTGKCVRHERACFVLAPKICLILKKISPIASITHP